MGCIARDNCKLTVVLSSCLAVLCFFQSGTTQQLLVQDEGCCGEDYKPEDNDIDAEQMTKEGDITNPTEDLTDYCVIMEDEEPFDREMRGDHHVRVMRGDADHHIRVTKDNHNIRMMRSAADHHLRVMRAASPDHHIRVTRGGAQASKILAIPINPFNTVGNSIMKNFLHNPTNRFVLKNNQYRFLKRDELEPHVRVMRNEEVSSPHVRVMRSDENLGYQIRVMRNDDLSHHIRVMRSKTDPEILQEKRQDPFIQERFTRVMKRPSKVVRMMKNVN